MFVLLYYLGSGISAQARILDIFYKDRGHIQYSYEIEGQEYVAQNAISKNTETKTLKKGCFVEIIVT